MLDLAKQAMEAAGASGADYADARFVTGCSTPLLSRT